jgi:hypothetical protein
MDERNSQSTSASIPDKTIAITGVSAVTLVEGPPQALLSAVTNGMSGTRPLADKRYQPTTNRHITSPVVIAAMEGLPTDPFLRILEILDRSLEALGNYLEAVDSATLGIALLLPLNRTGLSLDKEMIEDIIGAYFLELRPKSIELVSEGESATSALKRLCTKLYKNEIETGLFCGIDSWIDSQLFDKLAVEKRLLTQSQVNGVIPGEGGGAVLLQTVNHVKSSRSKNNDPLAILGNLAAMPEHHVGEAEEKLMMGMIRALHGAIGERRELINMSTCVLYSMKSDYASDLEWHQVKMHFWHQHFGKNQRLTTLQSDDEERQSDEQALRQEHNLAHCLGETGVATLPILLTLACEKIRFDAIHERFGLPVDSYLLLCELGNQPWRGALWLTPYDPPAHEVSKQ